jgi:hypothetical protein
LFGTNHELSGFVDVEISVLCLKLVFKMQVSPGIQKLIIPS